MKRLNKLAKQRNTIKQQLINSNNFQVRKDLIKQYRKVSKDIIEEEISILTYIKKI